MIKNKWEEGKVAELAFWRDWLPKKVEEYLYPTQLRHYFGELIGDKKEVDILDLGSGVLSTIGYVWEGVKVNLTLADVLADEYMKLLKEMDIKPIVPVEKQDMSDLSYPSNTFDIVHCRNALDHTYDPFGAIKEMVRVCKPGGWIYLAHFVHEGKRLGYRGFHQWNIDGEGEDCLFWNKENRFLLSECEPGFKTEVHEGGILSKKQK